MTTARRARRKGKQTATTNHHKIPKSLIDTVCGRLAANERIRRRLPDDGRLHIDRQLPFLCAYRRPSDREDPGTERLIQGEASYLLAPGTRGSGQSVSRMVRQIARTLSSEFGAFLIVEIWAGPEGGKANNPAVPDEWPTFEIHAPVTARLNRTVEVLEERLRRIKVLKQGVRVVVNRERNGRPPATRPLLQAAEARELNCWIIGLAVPPIYRESKSQLEFPLLRREFRHRISLALRHAFYEFSRSCTTHRPPHYHSLGRTAVVKAVWDIDRQLAAVSNQFDYLLQLTPLNQSDAWEEFQQRQFQKAPAFHYRPLPVDPALLKRELYKIPIERVEDPALQRVFQEKQEELELKLTMLRDRDTPRFLPESQQLFGGVQEKLLSQAKRILRELPRRGPREQGRPVSAKMFAKRAEREFAAYRKVCPDFRARTQVSPGGGGLMVSRGRLLIGEELSVSRSRVESLLAHEVGTHLVTYYNGRAQPFKQLYSGLAGYEELQEGLAVLAEYLVGGLSVVRMRQLAARVVAVRCLTDGASFVETFRLLERNYGFNRRSAYGITMRVFRGGGLTKDAVYLRGLAAVLKYVQKGGDLGLLHVGKIAVEHIPTIKELQYRQVLIPAPIIPHHLQSPLATERLAGLRGSKGSVVSLIGKRRRKNGTAT